jgi:magnesium transporter
VIEVRIYRNGRASAGPADLATAKALLDEDGVFVWLDASDPDEGDLEAIGETFGLHPLTIEDASHRRQRPKVELFEGYAFVALRPLHMGPAGELQDREVHAFVGPSFLGTLRYGPDPYPVEPARNRWERQADLFSREGGGFAAYVLIDEVVDSYLSLIEELEDRADLLEDDVFGPVASDGGADLQERVFRLKREVVRLRRVVMPLRQGLDLLQEEPNLAGPALQPYYRDLTEHVIRIAELSDNVRDLLTSLLEVRVSQVANHLNEIMKKLSAWAGIILVPTLIAGIYGMNFEEIPELHWAVGYPLALGMMLASAGALYGVFKRKGWL